MHTCVMVCGWPISSNVFCIMMKYPPIKKYPLVSASAAEAATNFKCCNLHILGHLGAPAKFLKVFSLRKNIPQRYCVLPVHSDVTHRFRHVKSCLKHEIWTLHLDLLPCNPKNWCTFFSSCSVGSFLVAILLNGTKHVLSTPLPWYNNFPIIHSIHFTHSVGSVGDISISLFSGHLHHMSVLSLNIADSVAFFVYYEWIGARLLLHVQARICLYTVFIIPFHCYTALYVSFPICCDIFIIHF